MSMTRTVSKDGLKVQPRESAGVCEYCGTPSAPASCPGCARTG